MSHRARASGTEPWPGPGDGRSQVHLVGFMGSGKSTVGARLARKLVWNFLDLDRLVERHAGTSIPDIFARRGEQGFRTMESHVLRQAVQKPRSVVALGGGTFADEGNRQLIAVHAISVWLDCPLEVVVARLGGQATSRPLWTDPEDVARLFRERRRSYSLAEVRIDASRDPDAVAESVLQALTGLPSG